MFKLTGFTDQPKQETNFVLADGSRVYMYLEYKPNQQGWFFSLTHDDFILDGIRLVPSPNILRQWKDVQNFGLLVTTSDNGEPYRQSAFVDGYLEVYLIDANELEEIDSLAFPGSSSATSGNALTSRFRPVASGGAITVVIDNFNVIQDDAWQFTLSGPDGVIAVFDYPGDPSSLLTFGPYTGTAGEYTLSGAITEIYGLGSLFRVTVTVNTPPAVVDEEWTEDTSSVNFSAP